MVAPLAPRNSAKVWRRSAAAEPDEVKVWLLWAGKKLLCLHLRSPLPSGYRSFWPDYRDDYGASNRERLRVPSVAPTDIPFMEMILGLPAETISDHQRRRIVHARSLIRPLDERHVFSYGRIAELEHVDERKAARLYVHGIGEIARFIAEEKASTIRSFLRI